MQKYVLIFTLLIGCFFFYTCNGEPYIGMIGGGNGEFDLKNSKLETSWGYYIGGRLGYRFCDHLRFEEELSYQHSRIDSLEKRGIRLDHVKGHINIWSLMTNALFDLDFPFLVSPYLGGGIGFAHEEGNGAGRFPSKHDHAKQDLHRNVFAWQLIVGLKYFICLGLEAGLEYRYFKLQEAKANHKLGLALTKFF